jgi:2-polyprenyl-3-methyl-5-hydroxy-6-metoxy-1,4-benzoquinol methylase
VEVVDDERDFYGIGYWTNHQASFAFPKIDERSRRDLPERCLFWLRAMLEFASPGGRVFEIGASHGGFLHLARLAGFHVDGVEISATVVDFARATFDVALRTAPFEKVDLPDRSQDVIAAFDVLEHFVDPCAALRRMRLALEPAGLLMLQTPQFPAESFQTLTASGHRFIEQLRAPEHQYLFSRRSIQRILAESGFEGVTFEPALFDYDMFVVAGGTGTRRTPEAIAGDLMQTPSGRTALAMLELHSETEGLRDVASARQAVIDGLKRACDERLALIEELDAVVRRLND